MSCESYDWKAYALGELDRPARREAEAHADACPACREELAALRMTLDALSTLREEEIPRRIAFVSDQIFEPRWYQRAFRSLWSPNFAAALVVAASILAHSFIQSAQIHAAVDKAVAVVEERHEQQVEEMVGQFSNRESEMHVIDAGLVRP